MENFCRAGWQLYPDRAVQGSRNGRLMDGAGTGSRIKLSDAQWALIQPIFGSEAWHHLTVQGKR
jgi:hypothetical protein